MRRWVATLSQRTGPGPGLVLGLGVGLLLGLALAERTAVLPSSGTYPQPMASAAQPAATGRGAASYASRAVDGLRNALRGLDPEVALERVPGEGLSATDPQAQARCAAAQGDLPVLVCHFGPAAERPVAQALFWHDRGGWQAQLYPQAPIRLAEARREGLAPLGCLIGCQSAIRSARLVSGAEVRRELLVVVDLGAVAGRPAEELHVLTLADGRWHLTWAPGEGEWSYGDARITLPTRGEALFSVTSSSWLQSDLLSGYLNGTGAESVRWFTERWVRKGDGFALRSRQELPGAYRSLVRLIHFLSTGADEKAAELTTVALEEARKALAQRPPRQGWRIAHAGEGEILLDPNRPDRQAVRVKLERRGEEWIVTRISPP